MEAGPPGAQEVGWDALHAASGLYWGLVECRNPSGEWVARQKVTVAVIR